MPVPATRAPEFSVPAAPLLELFSSIQGEGALLGRRQVFIRFAGCNLKCGYCDTPYAPAAHCRVEKIPGSGAFTPWRNPVQLAAVISYVQMLLDPFPRSHHSFALTGGEPLLHAVLLREWLPRLRTLLPVQLETNGTLPAALRQVLPWLDWISVDIKLESQTGAPTPWDLHREFIQLALQVQCCVKLVVGDSTPEVELHRTAELLTSLTTPTPGHIDVVLQPKTVNGQCSVSGRSLLQQQELLAEYGLDVRVIPQTHRFMQLL